MSLFDLTGRSRIYPLQLVKTMKCCGNRCFTTIAHSFAAVARSKFQKKDLKEQADWVKAYLVDHHIIMKGKFVYNFFLGLDKVCRTAWMQVIGLTRSRFYELKKAFEGNLFLVLHVWYGHKKNFTKILQVKNMLVWQYLGITN